MIPDAPFIGPFHQLPLVLNSRQKRSALRALKTEVTTLTPTASTYATLSAALEGKNADAVAAVSSGQIVSAAGNGKSTTWATGVDGSSASDWSEAWGEFLDTYDLAVEALDAAEDGTDDADIFAEMLDRLQPVTKTRSDFSGMREVA